MSYLGGGDFEVLEQKEWDAGEACNDRLAETRRPPPTFAARTPARLRALDALEGSDAAKRCARKSAKVDTADAMLHGRIACCLLGLVSLMRVLAYAQGQLP